MAQKIKLRRGLETNRTGITPDAGEIIVTTDNHELFIGDSSSAGGNEIGYLNLRTGGSVLGDVIFDSDVTINGDLTVTGTTTYVNTTNVNIGDNIIILNADETGTPSQNAGFEVERGTSANVSLTWNETTDVWQVTDTAGTRRILDTNDIVVNGDFTLDGLGNVTITSNSTGEILKWNGSAWVNNTLSEAGIQPLDGDLTAIAALAGTSGLLRKTATDTWSLDTTTYGTITNVSAGAGLTGGGTTGAITLNIGSSSTISVAADSISVANNSITSTQLAIDSDGIAGYALVADGDGTFSWQSISGTTNLAVANRTATSLDVTSSTGTNATIPEATTSLAGLLNKDDKVKLNNLSGTNTGDEVTATTTVQGIVELATSAEIDAGTAGALAMTPSSFAASQYATVGTVTSVSGGAGLTGTVTSSGSLNVGANADGSIVVNADDIQVGVVDGGTF